MAHLMVK